MADTKRTLAYLLSDLFQDGQPDDSITPQRIRDLIVSFGAWHLAQSAALSSHTGDTAETTLATVQVPSGLMGLNGALRITSNWSLTSSINSKTPRIRFGADGAAATHSGTIYQEAAFKEIAAYHDIRNITNRNSWSSQVGPPADALGGVGTSQNAVVTSIVDTTILSEIEFSAQLADAGDTLGLEAYLVEFVTL